MEPLEYLRIVLRKWPLVVALALVGAAVGYATAPASRPRSTVHAKSYTATYVLALDPTSAAALGSGGVTSSAPNLQSMAFLTTAGPVPPMAAKKLGYAGQPALLSTQVAVTPNSTINTLQISAYDSDPARATRIADAFATSLMDYLTQLAQNAQSGSFSRLQAALNDNQAQIVKLDQQIAAALHGTGGSAPIEVLQAQRQAYADRYSGLFNSYLNAVNAAPASSPLVTFQRAVAIPTSFTSTKSRLPAGKPERAALGALLGLVVAAGAVIAVDLLDPRIRSRHAVERAYGLPVLAELPVIRQSRRGLPAVLRAPGSAAADAYRVLRAALLLGARPVPVLATEASNHDGNGNGSGPAPGDARPQMFPRWDEKLEVLLVTAADERQGTSTVVANLGASFAEARRTVLVISADFRRPAVHRYLGAASVPGLTDALADGSPDALQLVARPTRVPGVALVPSGTPLDNEIELLTQVGPFLAEARKLADVVIIDTPPMTAVSDASELVPFVDGVLLVCRASSARVASARRALDIAARVGAPLIGVTLVKGKRRRPPVRRTRLDRAVAKRGRRRQAAPRVPSVPVAVKKSPVPPNPFGPPSRVDVPGKIPVDEADASGGTPASTPVPATAPAASPAAVESAGPVLPAAPALEPSAVAPPSRAPTEEGLGAMVDLGPPPSPGPTPAIRRPAVATPPPSQPWATPPPPPPVNRAPGAASGAEAVADVRDDDNVIDVSRIEAKERHPASGHHHDSELEQPTDSAPPPGPSRDHP